MQNWVLFPGKYGAFLGVLLCINFYIARIPAIFNSEASAEPNGQSWSYNNALLLVSVSVIPIACYGLFWSTCYMTYFPEFTAAPGK